MRRWWPVDLKRIIAPIAKHGGTIPEKISTPLFHIGRATRESKMSSAITRFSCYSPDTFSTGILVADGVSMDIFFLENNHKNGGWWWWGLGKRHSEALSAKAETRMIIWAAAAAAAGATMTTAMVAILNQWGKEKQCEGENSNSSHVRVCFTDVCNFHKKHIFINIKLNTKKFHKAPSFNLIRAFYFVFFRSSSSKV